MQENISLILVAEKLQVALYCVQNIYDLSPPLNYGANFGLSVKLTREYRNVFCRPSAALGFSAGALVVRGKGRPRASLMWRQILIWSVVVRTVCVS
jgi:hypothetical protein